MNEIIGSLSEYLDIIERIKKRYVNGWNTPASTSLLYRGISNEKYELLPSVFRKQFDKDGDKEIENSRYLAYVERDVRLIRDFRSEACGIIRNVDINDIPRWAEHAQHFGVPTRLLDFTSNALVALFFSCMDEQALYNGAVWMLHKNNYMEFWLRNYTNRQENADELLANIFNGRNKEIQYPYIYKPYYFDMRLSAQSSHFMVWGNNRKPFEEMIVKNQYMEPEPAGSTEVSKYIDDPEHFLFKVIVKASCKHRLLRQLEDIGINHKSLFPGLDGLGRYIEFKYRFNYGDALDSI